jgi:acyl transferase domain-containing protein
MTSLISAQIVNDLNKRLGLDLAPNTCHIHIDFRQLSDAVCDILGIHSTHTTVNGNSASSTKLFGEDIAVVGQALRLPGGINTPDSFWQALMQKRTDIPQPIPPTRWDHKSFYRPPESEDIKDGDITFERAGFIDLESFDNSFFGITAAEATLVTPSVRLVLETAFEALENANIPTSTIQGSNASVFVAMAIDQYQHVLFDEKGYESYTRHHGTGMANSTACGRLS